MPKILCYKMPYYKIVNYIWKRDKSTCQLCYDIANIRKNSGFNVHHIIPRDLCSAFIKYDKNMILVCGKCHHWIHSKDNINKEFLIDTMEGVIKYAKANEKDIIKRLCTVY